MLLGYSSKDFHIQWLFCGDGLAELDRWPDGCIVVTTEMFFAALVLLKPLF